MKRTTKDKRVWSDLNGIITIAANTHPTLNAGYYKIGHSPDIGMYFENYEMHVNTLVRLPNGVTENMLTDIEKFWNSRDNYEKYGRVYKRNYLLYSAPGTGKSSLINMITQDLINIYNGLVFYVSNAEEVSMLPDAMMRIRSIEPDRKVICVIEDIDSLANYSPRINTLLLNILDGNLKFDNFVVIATTNHIEDMEDRYCNRPSRFDKVIEFPLPNDESRRVFIKSTVLPQDLERINLEEWVKKTKGYTIDHINEIILLHCIFGESEENAFKQIDNMVKQGGKLENKESKRSKKKHIGFTCDNEPVEADCNCVEEDMPRPMGGIVISSGIKR